AAEVERLEPLAHDRTRRGLAIRRHRVFQVEDQTVGGQRERLRDHLLVAAGDEMERATAGHHASFLRIIAWRRQRITTSPCWFLPRCSNVTMPHCGRDFDSRLSTTSVSE